MIFSKMSKVNCVILFCLLNFLQATKCTALSHRLQAELNAVSTTLDDCAPYFQYQPIDEFINGNLTLPNLKIGDTVKLTFIPYFGSSAFKGLLLPDGSSQEIINKLQNGQPISYRVDFKLTTKVPLLEKIFINNNELCATKSEHYMDKVALQHTLDIINGTITVFTYNVNIPNFVEALQTSESSIIGGNVKDICGKSSDTAPPRTKHPWLATIYIKYATGVAFKCNGALISSQIIVARALCLHASLPASIRVYLGRHDLSSVHENGVVARDVTALYHHPGYNATHFDSRKDNNLVLLQLKAPVSFTEYVKPICLWSEPADPTEIVGQTATIIGWNVNSVNAGTLTVPTLVESNILSPEECQLPGNRRLSNFLCLAKNENDFLMLQRNGRWTLRGVRISKVFSANLTTYTDIAAERYYTWIQNKVSELGGES